MNKKIANPFALAFVLSIILGAVACKKADIKFGQEFLDNDITQVFKVDSFAVDLSTVYLDSFVSSAKGTVLLGSYLDPAFGRVNTSSYFELIPPSYADVYVGTILDSICLILKPNGHFYGDSTLPINVTVNELADSIYLPENYYSFYNNASFNVKPTSIVNTDITVRPKSNNPINIKLPTAFGNKFLDKLKVNTDIDLKTSGAFLRYFKGMKISTNNNSQMIVGCSDDVVMRLYYKTPSALEEHKYVDFTLSNKAHQFNNISVDRTNTVLGGKNFGPSSAATREISSTKTGNVAYMQASTGSLVKLTFPTLKNIPLLPNYAKILKATLLIRPVQSSYTPAFYLPASLRLSNTDANNTIGYDLAGLTTVGYAAQLGSLYIDGALGSNTQYQYDLTQYIRTILETQFITPGEGLLLSPPSPNFETEFARTIIGNKNNNAGKTQLIIYYAAVK